VWRTPQHDTCCCWFAGSGYETEDSLPSCLQHKEELRYTCLATSTMGRNTNSSSMTTQ
jgi:hypothetical protein